MWTTTVSNAVSTPQVKVHIDASLKLQKGASIKKRKKKRYQLKCQLSQTREYQGENNLQNLSLMRKLGRGLNLILHWENLS